MGCAGLGLSLYQIHIYVAVLKRALQVQRVRYRNGVGTGDTAFPVCRTGRWPWNPHQDGCRPGAGIPCLQVDAAALDFAIHVYMEC